MEDQIVNEMEELNGAVDGVVFERVKDGALVQFIENHTVLATLAVFTVGMVAGIGALKGFRLAKAKWVEHQATIVVEEEV